MHQYQLIFHRDRSLEIEGKQSEVVLIRTWASSYCKRVELALKLKGIPYEYVQEDLANKSELLLHHNPVHKKVPVLVHKGKAIVESLVILEYIDEHWNNSPILLPIDPYQRSKVSRKSLCQIALENFVVGSRNVVPLINTKEGTLSIIVSKGEAQEKAIEDMIELLRVFENGIKNDFPGKLPFDDQNLELLDIIVSTNACNYQAFNEAVAVVMSPEKTPTEFFLWVNAFKGHPLIKDTLPPHDKLVAKMKRKFFQSL
ncbi:S-crystallin [Trema orientale]|uniref:glutathione transferase n=1 Tax=Trema orientale TaxID=63057 RepID=A0A2P5D185_TREOI|nr:S-crystallin [Trema orientale]